MSILSIISIIQASNLQHASSSHRNLIRDTIFLVEKSIIENKVFNSYNSLIINSRSLLKEVDESIYFDELIHNPTKILGYIASTTVISSAEILEGLKSRRDGFGVYEESIDANGIKTAGYQDVDNFEYIIRAIKDWQEAYSYLNGETVRSRDTGEAQTLQVGNTEEWLDSEGDGEEPELTEEKKQSIEDLLTDILETEEEDCDSCKI